MRKLELPTLHGKQVTLRPAAAEELGTLAALLAGDPESSPWLGADSATITQWLAEDSVHPFTVVLEGRPAGVITFEEQLAPDCHSASIDIALLAWAVGRGIGPEALMTLARWLVDVRGHHRITIDPAVANTRAVRAYAKVGFKPVGVMREYELGPDGAWHDNLLMDMLARELER